MTFWAFSILILQISHAQTFKKGILGASKTIQGQLLINLLLCVVQIFMNQTLSRNILQQMNQSKSRKQ
jgi:hypothetical protein